MNRLRILIVDDSPDDRSLIRRLVVREFPGSEVEEARDPATLAAALEKGGFDLVSTDFQLGWSDGLAVLRAVRERWPDCPVIMVTATGSEEIAVEAMKAGLDDYVLKSAKRMVRVAAAARSALEKAEQRRALREYSERLETLSQRLLRAQEEERRHIARELHDEVGQALTALKINLETARRSPDLARAVERLDESVEIVDRALQQVRDLSLDLRPSMLDDLGLVPALRWQIGRYAERTGVAAALDVDTVGGRASPEVETACFRVVLEALTNTARHAKAGRVDVALRRHPRELELVVRDDGAGFDADAALRRAGNGESLGLVGMRERAHLVGGRLTIDSTPGHGTEIRAWFPLRQEGENPVSENAR